MPRFAVSFFSDLHGMQATLVDASDREGALKKFFEKEVKEYTKNGEGFAYFKEDFQDDTRPLGAVVEILN
jgi:hypothetical protein